MTRSRRTKNELAKMNNEVRLYLFQTNLDYYKAYDLFIKDHLENNMQLPYYIKGIKDFKAVSEEMAVELNRKDQMAKKDQQRAEAKEIIIQYILNLSKDDVKMIWKEYKDKVNHTDKLNIVDITSCILNDEMKEAYINQSTINTFTKIYHDQL